MTDGQNTPYTAERKQIWAWGIGGVANHALIQTFGQVTNLFILGFGLSPVLVSRVMTIPRLLDGIIDPFIGHLSDNTHTHWGRRTRSDRERRRRMTMIRNVQGELMKRMLIQLAAVCVLVAGASAAEWQWSVPVPQRASTQPAKDTPRAFLWIPSDCKHVRGIVFGRHNMEEEPILEHPVFRKALTEVGFAEVWVAPGFDVNFRQDADTGRRFDAMMQSLADVSGYSELTSAPLVPVGHSAASGLPWAFASWKPERVLAAISFSGSFPSADEKTPGMWNVPGIVTIGEYEWADENIPKGLPLRQAHPEQPLSGMGCPADGHFAATDEKVAFLALYVKKAARYRLPADTASDAAPQLITIDATKTGWLVDRYRLNKDPLAPAAPIAQYKGDPAQAYWYFDEEIAKAAQAFQTSQRGKAALLGYVQDGKVVPQRPGSHQQVNLAFNPQDDGVTFKLSATFLDVVPGGRPARWTGKKEGDAIEKPTTSVPIDIRRICGPIRKVSDDTWVLDFDHASFLGDWRGNEAWLAAIWPGDGPYKRMVQQSRMGIPGRNGTGQPQTITFPKPLDVPAGTTLLKLAATSDAGVPVRYCVREGPAEVDGDTLKFTAIPPRAKFPLKVTVIAWQFGRGKEPKLQSAAPVEQSFFVVGHASSGVSK